MLPKTQKQTNGETDAGETDGGKTGQDTNRQTEGMDRCYHHIWTEKHIQVHAGLNILSGMSSS